MTEMPIEDAQALVKAIVDLTQMAGRALPLQISSLATRLRAHLGTDGDSLPNTSASFPITDRVNVQLALDALEEDAEVWQVVGLAPDLGNHGNVSLASMVSGSWHGPGESARQYVSADVGPDETISCLRSGLILTSLDGVAVVAMVYVSERHMPEVTMEIAAADQPTADRFLQRVRELMDQRNAYRGKVVTFSYGRHGEFGMTFTKVPVVTGDQVVLRDGDLTAIEDHAIGISRYADELIAAGQHVKRGLLLYGPPGTGKTHTVSYLLGAMAGRTTIILSGAAVGAVGQAGAIARSLQPATVVIEDVDLIGMDRSLPGGEHNPMLFQLLNEMDGLADDVDVLFILTTNRVDMLEPALTARPGRIDQAIEIGLPDAAARRRLVELYAGVALSDGDDAGRGAALIARLDGVAPAFIKELARRATLLALRTPGRSVVDALSDALDAMHRQSAPILRASLAAGRTHTLDN